VPPARAEATASSRSASGGRVIRNLSLIAQGMSNAPARSSSTKRAVERHVNAIFLKLGLRDADDVGRRVDAALVYLADEG
jgi:DNA-binding NarL/FixJ family response regulator